MLHLPLVVVSAALALPGADLQPHVKSGPGAVTLTNCMVSVSQQAQVPAREAGLLTDIPVKDGQQVKEGQALAQIDDMKSQLEYRAAVFKYEEEKAQAENDIDVRYSRAKADVAYALVLISEEANQKVPGAVPQSQVREQKLAHKEAVLAIEQSQFKQQIHALETKVKQAEADAAMDSIQRRKVLAPFDGVIVELRKQKGEWVQAGDTVLRMLRVDRLWVEGFLSASEYSQGEILNRPVTVAVNLAHGRRETFQGKIVFVNSEIEANGEFRIRAEVFNRQENDVWLLNKGATAEMTVHLK